MAVRQYIGARYVPLYAGDWDSTKNYEPLTIVTDANDNSFTSLKDVPAGTALTDRSYWIQTSSFSAAVDALNRRMGVVENDISNIETDLEKIGRFISPRQFGAVGDGVTDDSAAFNAMIEYVTKNTGIPVVLDGRFKIDSEVVFNNQSSVSIYGGTGAVDTTIADPALVKSSNIIFGDSGKFKITGISSVSFINVNFHGGVDGVVIASFRNRFINCGFQSFTGSAISTDTFTNWVGENVISQCTFNDVETCIKLDHGSDGDIFGNLADGTCRRFIESTADSGYKIMNNHDYSNSGSKLIGFNTLVEGNYFDGYGKLEITGNSSVSIIGNEFLLGATVTHNYVIKFSSGTVLHGEIVGNAVHTSTPTQVTAGLAFLNIDDVQYFNNVLIDANNIRVCEKIYSTTTGSRLYNWGVMQPIGFSGANLAAVAPTPTINRGILSNGLAQFNYDSDVSNLTYADFLRLPVSGIIPIDSYFMIVTVTTSGGDITTYQTGNTVRISNYASATHVKITAFGVARTSALVKES